MVNNIPIFNQKDAVHIAVVVKDLEEALENYCYLFQLERPLIKLTGEPSAAKVEYLGKPTLARAKQAFLQFGLLRVEFLEPDEHASIWREFLETNGEGIHHIAFEVSRMDEVIGSLKQEGMELIQEGLYNGGRYAYIRSGKKLKTIVELLENDT